MKLVFIAGPYFGDGSHEIIKRNISSAQLTAIQLANRRIPFFCPHLHTAHFELKATAPEPFYAELALQILPICGAVVLLPNWEISKGTAREIETAKALNIPIFEDIEGVEKWAMANGE